MSLRLKVALLLVAMVIPITVFFAFVQMGSASRDVQERVADRVLARGVDRGSTRCERRPERFNFERRGLLAYAYRSDFTAWRSDAPPFPDALKTPNAEVGEPLHVRYWRGPFEGASAVRTGKEDCAWMVAYWNGRPGPPRPGKVAFPVAVLAAVLLGTGFLITFPLVRRIRRLQEAVDGAESTGFRIEVETDSRDEIGDLARAFDDAGKRVSETVDALNARDKTLQEYISNTTHDLAIPLTVLQHRLHRLRDSLDSEDERTELIDTALEESHYIAALIKNMNVAAKLDAGEFHIATHQCDLRDVVTRVLNRHQPVAETKGLEIAAATPDDPVEVECDSVLVEQALSNLVQNAIQYTSKDGHVAILLEPTRDGFELRVLDDGPGVPPEMLDAVLRRAARGDDARSRNPDGQGFGLSIAKRVTDLHSWTLKLENGHPGLIAVINGKRTEA